MISKMKMVLSIAIVLGTGSAALATNEHRTNSHQPPRTERPMSPFGSGSSAHGLAPLPDNPSSYQGPGHVIAGWEI
jgi:hypothetical protein